MKSCTMLLDLETFEWQQIIQPKILGGSLISSSESRIYYLTNKQIYEFKGPFWELWPNRLPFEVNNSTVISLPNSFELCDKLDNLANEESLNKTKTLQTKNFYTNIYRSRCE